MTENKNTIPEISENKPMTDEQLEEVAGGWARIDMERITLSMSVKRCTANPEHLYKTCNDVCPYCGCKEFTIV